jgi:hypothetical protein
MSAIQKLMNFVAALAAVLCLGFCIASTRQYLDITRQERAGLRLQQELNSADALTDPAAAVAAYLKIRPSFPELELRVLQRQWHIALATLKTIQLCRYNAALERDVPAGNARLKEQLDAMLEQCSASLAGGAKVRSEVLWQLHNISGSARLLKAFVMLEDEKNADKVQGVLRDALADFKSAIETVDGSAAPGFDKNIPRWNFELLNSQQYVKKIEAARTDIDKNQALKENLETLIPEMGGYAPGEPVETKIKK